MAPRPPLFVTLTGADDGVDIARMADLSARYPVEWGVLFAPERQSAGRFPSLEFVAKLIERGGMPLSAHLCGGYAREVISRGACDELAGLFAGNFDRAQINTSERGVEADRVRRFTDAMGMRGAILQCRGDFPDDPRVDWLFDKSGGRGRLLRLCRRPEPGHCRGCVARDRGVRSRGAALLDRHGERGSEPWRLRSRQVRAGADASI